MEKVDLTAKWIWCEDNKRKNDFVLFRKEFELEQLPLSAAAYIGVGGLESPPSDRTLFFRYGRRSARQSRQLPSP